jgi:polyphenol oxidase
VRTTSLSLPAGPSAAFSWDFPGPRGEGEPLALLSAASSGDMKYGDPGCAPNRERFLRDRGLDPARALGLHLAHSRRILFPAREGPAGDPGGAGGDADADGLILDDPGLAATVTVADCMPIWILDRGSGVFGLLHSGWRGTGILETAVHAMAERFGSRPESLAVILGPAIGPCCYAVPEERAAGFAAAFGESSAPRRGGSSYLDLRAANLAIAERLGLGQLLSIEACTACDPRLGSYRRQGPSGFTRMLALCGRLPRPRSRPA